MRPRARDKKLLEEWALPLKSVEDVYEVLFLTKNVEKFCYNCYDWLEVLDCFISEIYEVLPWKVEKQSLVWIRRSSGWDKDNKRTAWEN